jgi:hypothetical protein
MAIHQDGLSTYEHIMQTAECPVESSQTESAIGSDLGGNSDVGSSSISSSTVSSELDLHINERVSNSSSPSLFPEDDVDIKQQKVINNLWDLKDKIKTIEQNVMKTRNLQKLREIEKLTESLLDIRDKILAASTSQ